jgi:DNA-binding NarL/FixJ family response regulator
VDAETFVGRAPELEALQRALTRAAAGEARVALLVGEPGVGKTRLAREFTARAAARGAIALWGAAYESWTPPYGPWTQALSSYLEGRGKALPVDSAVLSAVVPRLREAHPEAVPAPSLGSRDEQFRLHDAVSRLLADAERTVVLVLDDLQWADRASLELVLAVSRSAAGVLVVAPLRDETSSEALADCLAELTRERRALRLEVARLNAEESGLLLQRLLDEPVPASLAGAIFEQTQGNAFFIEELARHARASPTGEWAVPDTIRLAVGAHVRRLSPEAARLLGVASVFTRPFAFGALQALSELPEETVLDALDEALAARLLRIARSEAESYEFGHDLVRQSIYEELNPSRRARLHRRAAQALEQLGGGSDLETAAELAAQYHRSSSLPGAAHGVGYALTAAAEAGGRYAFAEAAQLLRTARDLSGELDPGRRAAILCRLALAEADALELHSARRTADQALAELERSAAGEEETAEFLWALARRLKDAGAAEEELRPLVVRGLRLLGDEHELSWARLSLVLRPAEPLRSGRIVAERWLGYDPEAVRIARASGDELDHAATLELMDWRDGDEIGALLERCRGWREPVARIHALSIASRTLLYNLGAFREALEVSRDLLAESERAGALAGAAYAHEQIADVEIAFGDFEPAVASLARARETAAKLGAAHRIHFIIGFVETRLMLFRGGDWEAVGRHYERAATDPGTPWPWISIQAASLAALAYARAEQVSHATRLLDELLPLLERLSPTTLNQNAAVATAGDVVWELRDATRAATLWRLGRALVEAGVGDYVTGSNALTVARMAALLGEDAEAAESFARVQATLHADGRRPLAAVAAVDSAASSSAPPLAYLREAGDLLSQLGMTRWAERAATLLEQATAAPPAGLTSREVEILNLLAGGRTNREIAAELVLSVHTIERHLANAHRKIGARNRADATAFALRNL